MNLLFFIYFSEKKIIKAKHFLNEIFFILMKIFYALLKCKMRKERSAFKFMDNQKLIKLEINVAFLLELYEK